MHIIINIITMSYISINGEPQNNLPDAISYIKAQLDNSNLKEMYIKFQDGTVKECGENGLQWYSLLEVALAIVSNFNANFPCRENEITITKIQEAMMWQQERTRERSLRGVEGYSQK